MEIQITKKILSELLNAPDGIRSGTLRELALLPGATNHQRDTAMDACRALGLIIPFGGAGRGRSYKITGYGSAFFRTLTD